MISFLLNGTVKPFHSGDMGTEKIVHCSEVAIIGRKGCSMTPVSFSGLQHFFS